MIGVQHKNAIQGHSQDFMNIKSFVEKPSNDAKPRYWEAASVTDSRCHYTKVAIPYWRSKEDFDQWRDESGSESWWEGLDAGAEVEYLLEVFLHSVDRFEIVSSDNVEPEGVANMRTGVSGMLQEYVYSGSMRDRLAASQTDYLKGEKATIRPAGGKEDTTKRRIHVEGRQNLAMIRSGQGWTSTSPHERELCLNTMHPVLIMGMDFLRDQGAGVGCIECRSTDVIRKDKTSQKPTDKTFGLAYFDDMNSFEDWSKRHNTTLDIFGRFLQYAGELQGSMSLRLPHEVMVVYPEQQYFQYVGCHDTTGMLASI